MKIATYANVRVANRARETENVGETVKVAFRGGSVMGLCVGGFALLGIFLVYMVFGVGMGQARITSASYTNLLGLSFCPFTMTLSGYALDAPWLPCSTVWAGESIPRQRIWELIWWARPKRISRKTTPGIRQPSQTM